MTQPIDMLTGAQTAVVTLLQTQLPPAERGMVRHSLKKGAEPPFHLIGDIASENAGTKDDQFEEIEVDVHTVYRGTDRGELLKLMHQVRAAADEETVEVAGATFRVSFLGALASGAASDGVTFAGITTLQLSAEPA